MTTFEKYLVANNARWQLKVGIWAGSLSLVLDTDQGDLFPAHSNDYLCTLVQYDVDWVTVLKREIVKVTNKVWDTFTIERGAWACPWSDTETSQWTTAYAFDAGDYFYLNIVAELIEDIQDETTRLEADKLDTVDYQNWAPIYWASAVGTDSYAITPTPAISAYSAWQKFRFLADVGNTGACSLNVNWKWAKTIKKMHDQDLWTWDIEAWQMVEVIYDGTYMQMTSQVASEPNIDIDWQIEKTDLLATNDEFIIFDSADSSDKKIKQSKLTMPCSMIAWTSNTAFALNTERSTTSTNYVKIKEATITISGTYTMAFEAKENWCDWKLRIYKNWSPFWTEQTINSATYLPFTEDLAFVAWDVVALYYKSTNWAFTCYVKNFTGKGELVFTNNSYIATNLTD